MEERLAWSYFAVLPLILIFLVLGNEVSNWKIWQGLSSCKTPDQQLGIPWGFIGGDKKSTCRFAQKTQNGVS